MTEDTLEVAETSPPEDAESSIEDSSPQETVAEPDSPPETDEPKRSRAAERITELVAERTAAKEYGEYMRQEVVRLQTQITGTQLPQETIVPKPKLEDFQDHDDWATAFSDWSVKEASKVAQAQVNKTLRQQTTANEEVRAQARFQERQEEFVKDHSDYFTIIQNPTLKINQEMVDVFKESEQGPAIVYHLAKNPDVSAKISRMKPRQMALAIGRLENEVSKPTHKSQPTNAPAPLNPVGGQQPSVDLVNMDIDEYMAHRREERRAKGL